MAIETYWWGLLIVAVLIVFFIVIFAIKKKKSKNINSNLLDSCKHDWKYGGVILIFEKYLRGIFYCNRCGKLIHRAVIKSS